MRSIISIRALRAAWLAAAVLATGAVQASPFKDPLDTPAAMTAAAGKSRLMALGQAQGRLMAAGADGVILASDDAGGNWRQCKVPVSSDLVAVRVLTKDKAWAVGHDGVVLHTADGCKSWVLQLDGRLAAKAELDYYEAKAKAGDASAESFLADARRAVEEGPDKPFFDVLFLNEQEGFAVGAFNMVLRTRDGGTTWTPLRDRTENPQGFHLYGLARSGSTLLLVGEQGLMRRWNAEQERFEKLDSPYKGSFFGAAGSASQLLVYGMRGHAFRSSDGGTTWTQLKTNTTASLTSGTVLADGRAVLTTYTGMVLVGDAQGGFAAFKPAQPMSYTSVAAIDAGRIVLAGNVGVRVESLQK
jgi:photosystem II stability/assembly factor-like uncharacterized protein